MKLLNRITFIAPFMVMAIAPPVLSQTPTAREIDAVIVEATPVKVSKEKDFNPMQYIEIRNFQDEPLGRISELGVDLVNGRIVEVLVVSDDSLHLGAKIVAVPPLALISDAANEVYRLNTTVARFKTAAAIDLSNWDEAGRSDRVAAAYRLFGQDPYFLEDGETASKTARRPQVALGYVQRSSRILDLTIRNRQDEELGEVWSMMLDIPAGRILSVVVVSQGNFRIKNVVPAMALSFNAARDGLILNDSPQELEDEPRYFYTAAAYGQDAHSRQEAYAGPAADEQLTQGKSYRDVDQTVRIHRAIRATGIDCENIEVGTLHDRVTLRGTVATADEKRRIGDSAIGASRPELVDNQLSVKPAATS